VNGEVIRTLLGIAGLLILATVYFLYGPDYFKDFFRACRRFFRVPKQRVLVHEHTIVVYDGPEKDNQLRALLEANPLIQLAELRDIAKAYNVRIRQLNRKPSTQKSDAVVIGKYE
jgi:hypothetical protein